MSKKKPAFFKNIKSKREIYGDLIKDVHPFEGTDVEQRKFLTNGTDSTSIDEDREEIHESERTNQGWRFFRENIIALLAIIGFFSFLLMFYNQLTHISSQQEKFEWKVDAIDKKTQDVNTRLEKEFDKLDEKISRQNDRIDAIIVNIGSQLREFLKQIKETTPNKN